MSPVPHESHTDVEIGALNDSDSGTPTGPYVYECGVCWALTREPDKHRAWHEGVA